jgi:hypothetical protein
MMHGHEKSDFAIVAGKLANNAEQSAAEPVERRAGAKGNVSQQSTSRTQSRTSVSQALERIRQRFAVTHPRWESYAGKPPVRFCAENAQQWAPLPLLSFLLQCIRSLMAHRRPQTMSAVISAFGPNADLRQTARK